jgi:creatinine amidohydrolase/Fe(II)-dependent formamide hydrolase-like protein
VRVLTLLFLLALLVAQPARAGAPSVHLEDLTWTELRDRIAAGATTVLMPLGGTEQNGPHMALGKHNVRVRLLAERIAMRLGQALVAPVVAYVPEGEVDPPTQHMRWPGTITVPAPVFEATLEAAVRSFRKHGFCHVVLLGDHGGYRASLDRVVAHMNKPGATACRVHAMPEYYRASSGDFAQALKAQGYSAAEIGTHAGLADTALLLALEPALVRGDKLSAKARGGAGDGVAGDPTRATAELGKPGIEHIIDSSVAAIRAATRPSP